MTESRQNMREKLIACFQDTCEKSHEGILKLKTERAIQSNRVYKEGFVSKEKEIAIILKKTLQKN